MERRLADELDRRDIVVWYDEPEDWRAFVEQQLGGGQVPSEASVCDVRIRRARGQAGRFRRLLLRGACRLRAAYQRR